MQPLLVKTRQGDLSGPPTYNTCVNRGTEVLHRGSQQSLEQGSALVATQKLKALTQLPWVDLITGAANTRGGLLQPGLSVQKRKYDSIVL